MKDTELVDRITGIIGKKEERKGIHVTSLIYECMRRAYYSEYYGGAFFDKRALIRFFIGKGIHSTPILEEHELALNWNGVQGSVDEYEDGTLLEKKHTSRKFPNELPDHYVKQVEYYKVLLEKSGRRVDNAYVLYINVAEANLKLYPVKFQRDSGTIEKEMRMKKDILVSSIKEKALPKAQYGWLCNYCNFASVCFSQALRKGAKEVETNLDKELAEKYGKRYESAKAWLKEPIARTNRLTVTEPLEISSEVRGSSDNYAVFVSDKTKFCSCADYQTKKVLCKHIIYSILRARKEDKIDEEEMGRLMGI